MVSHPLLDVINDYTETVRAGRVKCGRSICPRCNEPCDGFKIHERRARTFQIVIERLVHRVGSLAVRWLCGACEKTFTSCPDFALPRKRYVRDVVFHFGKRHLADDHASYRSAVRVEEMPVFYDHGGPDGAVDERTLAASTLHRWLGWSFDRRSSSSIGARTSSMRPSPFSFKSRPSFVVGEHHIAAFEQIGRRHAAFPAEKIELYILSHDGSNFTSEKVGKTTSTQPCER